MQKSLEDTVNKIIQEEDQEKKLKLINVNLFRRRSLMRVERDN
jgi:hypothetical protein